MIKTKFHGAFDNWSVSLTRAQVDHQEQHANKKEVALNFDRGARQERLEERYMGKNGMRRNSLKELLSKLAA